MATSHYCSSSVVRSSLTHHTLSLTAEDRSGPLQHCPVAMVTNAEQPRPGLPPALSSERAAEESGRVSGAKHLSGSTHPHSHTHTHIHTLTPSHSHLSQEEVLSQYFELRDQEIARQKSLDCQLRNELYVTLKRWRGTRRFFTGERGAWSSRFVGWGGPWMITGASSVGPGRVNCCWISLGPRRHCFIGQARGGGGGRWGVLGN